MPRLFRILACSTILLLSSCAASLFAGECNSSNGASFIGFANEAVTVSTTSIGFTAATFNPDGNSALMAVFTTETDTLRFWTSGAAPTSSVGHTVSSGSTVVICGAANIKQFRSIRSGSSNVTMEVSYYR